MTYQYTVLQVARNASLEVIQAAFLARTNAIQKEYANDPKKLHNISLILLSSYNTLIDPEKRRHLDLQLEIEDAKGKITATITKGEIQKSIDNKNNSDRRIDPTFNPQSSLNNNFTIKNNRAPGKNKIKNIIFFTLGIAGILLAFANSNKVIEYLKKAQDDYGLKSLVSDKPESQNESQTNKTTKLNDVKKTNGLNANAAAAKESNEKKSNKSFLESKEIVSSNKNITNSQDIRLKKENLQQVKIDEEKAQQLKIEQEKAQQLKVEQEKAQQLKIEQDKALALEFERNQILAQQKLRCDKARLSYNNSKNRINSVRSTYQNKINEIEKDIQNTALASLTLAFKDRRALSAGADMNRPKEELQRQIQAKMNDEVNILETELEQFKITNLECFR